MIIFPHHQHGNLDTWTVSLRVLALRMFSVLQSDGRSVLQTRVRGDNLILGQFSLHFFGKIGESLHKIAVGQVQGRLELLERRHALRDDGNIVFVDSFLEMIDLLFLALNDQFQGLCFPLGHLPGLIELLVQFLYYTFVTFFHFGVLGGVFLFRLQLLLQEELLQLQVYDQLVLKILLKGINLARIRMFFLPFMEQQIYFSFQLAIIVFQLFDDSSKLLILSRLKLQLGLQFLIFFLIMLY